MMENLENLIRVRAYELWERAGCPDGRSWEFWFAARREIEGERPKPLQSPIDEAAGAAVQRGARPAA
jgi:hypothetical protein